MRFLTPKEFAGATRKQHTTLLHIVAMLCAMVEAKSVHGTISDHVKSVILKILRPAESATRRLIYVVMRRRGLLNATDITATKKAAGVPKSKAVVPALAVAQLGLAHISSAPKPTDDVKDTKREADPKFNLFDTSKQFALPNRLTITKRPPHIRFFHVQNQHFNPEKKKPAKAKVISPRNILRRLKALQNALDHVPAHAKRMAHEIRNRRLEPDTLNLSRLPTPLRPGVPPGFRERPKNDGQAVLLQTMWLVHEIENLPP